MFDDTSSSVDEPESIENAFPNIRNDRHSDSAEKYFDWASKTNRKFIKDISTYMIQIFLY